MNEINFNIEDIEKIDLSMDVGVKEIHPPIEDLEVTPTKEQQIFTHENSYGYDNVTVGPIPEEYIIPNGTLNVDANGDVDVTMFRMARVGVYTPPKLQTKEITPTKEMQVVGADEEYDGLDAVVVNPIPEEYIIPSGTLDITENGEKDVTNYSKVNVNVEGTGGSGKYAPRYIRFQGYSGTELDEEIANLDTSNMLTMYYMFDGCAYLQRLDLSHFDTSNVTYMGNMFSQCSSLQDLDISNFDTNKVGNMSYMFSGIKSSEALDLSHFDTSNVTDMSYMFQSNSNRPSIDISSFDTSKVTNMSYMFSNCSKITSLDLSHFNTNKATNMSYMFRGCSALTKLNLSGFDTTKVTSATYVFNGCTKLTTLVIDNPVMLKITNANAFTNSGIASGICTVYVPDDLVETYKTNTYWSPYANQIKGMSEYTG